MSSPAYRTRAGTGFVESDVVPPDRYSGITLNVQITFVKISQRLFLETLVDSEREGGSRWRVATLPQRDWVDGDVQHDEPVQNPK